MVRASVRAMAKNSKPRPPVPKPPVPSAEEEVPFFPSPDNVFSAKTAADFNRDLDKDEAVDEAARLQTEPGRDQHIDNAKTREKELAAALRKAEETVPLMAGSKYIDEKLRPILPRRPTCRDLLPSNTTIKKTISKMRRGQL
jgi:hypothetical protein